MDTPTIGTTDDDYTFLPLPPRPRGVYMSSTEWEAKKVKIQPGWLMAQFSEHVLGSPPGHSVPINPDFLAALERLDALVVQKDFQYDSSWQTLGEIIPVADMIDKLARLSGAWKNGAAISWDPDKRKGVMFDIIVRAFMILAWEGANFVDDDLDIDLDKKE
jgi:hypothetical protein